MVAAKNLIIRADAGAKIGSGHLMRSLALAQGWQAEGGTVVFVTNCESRLLRERLKSEKSSVVQIENSYPHPADVLITRRTLKDFPKSWCVIDGYHFDAEFHAQIHAEGNRILVIDDTAHLDFYEADVILNQNINAADLHYLCPKDTILCLGTRYSLLRNEFLEYQNFRREIPTVARKILITLGGGDFHNQTLKAMQVVELSEIENLEVKVILGANNPHFDELRNFIGNSRLSVELIKNSENMSELMAWADVAISAAGSTCWELAFMKLPCVLIVTAENQTSLAAGLEKSGFAYNAGWFERILESDLARKTDEILIDAKRRSEMMRKGGEIVDGRGVMRLVETLKD